MASVKTTLELPDDLMREIKIRAVHRNRRLKDEIAELLRRGLSEPGAERSRAPRRVRLPLVKCARAARSGEEMTPERVARILLEEEAGTARDPLR
jgi:hypothetical protein